MKSGVAKGPIATRTACFNSLHQYNIGHSTNITVVMYAREWHLRGEFCGASESLSEDDEAADALALHLVREAHHRRLGYLRARHQSRLHLGGADAVSRGIDDIVHAAWKVIKKSVTVRK